MTDRFTEEARAVVREWDGEGTPLADALAASLRALDAEWRERVKLRANRMDAPDGPECWCGAPSAFQHGECAHHGAVGLRHHRVQQSALVYVKAWDCWMKHISDPEESCCAICGDADAKLEELRRALEGGE